MVGRKAAVSSQEILSKLLNFDIFENQIVKKRSDKVWFDISKKLNNLIKPTTLNLFMSQNEHNVLTYFKKYKGLEEPIDDCSDEKIKTEEDNILSTEEKSDSSSDIDEPPKRDGRKRKITFEIHLTQEEWSSIQPKPKIYKDGHEGLSLLEGWTDMMRQAICYLEKLPCAFSFKRHFVGGDDFYIIIVGHCTDCSAEITIHFQNKPLCDAVIVIFRLKTSNTKNIPHNKKARLQKCQKNKLKDELKYKKPKQ